MGKMTWILAFLAVALVISSPCHAQEWAISYGDFSYEIALSIKQTSDGGYIMAGATYSFGSGSYDIWAVKLNSFGNIEWQKTYGGSKSDVPRSILQTSDGGYIIAADTSSFGAGSSDILILKLDSAGNIEWQRTYGESSYEGMFYNVNECIFQTSDGGYVVAGTTLSFNVLANGIWVFKLDSVGNIEWQKTYDGQYGPLPGEDFLQSFNQTGDGGYILAVHTYIGEPDFTVLLKLDSDGNIEWQKEYRDGENYYLPTSIKETADGGFVMAGYTDSSTAGAGDILVFKLDSLGNIEWQKVYGGSEHDLSRAILQTSDTGYVIVGETQSYGAGEEDIWILKLNPDGTIQWQKTYGGSGEDNAYSIQLTADEGYILAGRTYSFGAGNADCFILKLNPNGEILECDVIGTSNASVSDTSVVVQDPTVISQASSAAAANTTVSSTDTEAETYVICSGVPENQPPIANAGPDLTILNRDQDITVIQGTASDPDDDPLTYRWLEGTAELSAWEDVGENGEAYLDLGTVPHFSIGDHTLTLEVDDGDFTSTDEMVLTVEPLTIDDILDFFDESVENETLKGRGRGWFAKLRLCLMRQLLVIAGEFIERDRIKAACFLLHRAHKRCDGEPWPRDFVKGPATEGLAEMIVDLMENLGCK